MILPLPGAKPPPVDPPPTPAPPEVTTLSGGLPSLLYVNPPPPSPLPDASRGKMSVTDRVHGLELKDFEWRPLLPPPSADVEVMEWRGVRAPRPPPAEPPWQCPECLVGHWESAVILQRQYISTMLVTSFYDKQDIWHVHDPNVRTTWFVCTRGHRWTIQETLVCPELTCVWPTVA